MNTAALIRFQVRYPGRLGYMLYFDTADEQEANRKLDRLDKGCVRRIEHADNNVVRVKTIRTKGGYIA